MIRFIATAFLLGVSLSGVAASGAAASPAGLRCGWFDNPSPGNVTLIDRDGQWLIAEQGGHQVEWSKPSFATQQWVAAGAGSYGYGCACLKVRARSETREVLRIESTQARPLSVCRADPVLRGREPG